MFIELKEGDEVVVWPGNPWKEPRVRPVEKASIRYLTVEGEQFRRSDGRPKGEELFNSSNNSLRLATQYNRNLVNSRVATLKECNYRDSLLAELNKVNYNHLPTDVLERMVGVLAQWYGVKTETE